MSKLEYYLWGADFTIGGIGWFFGGPYAAIGSVFVGAVLIFIGLSLKDESEGSPRPSILTDKGSPYPRVSRLRMWHKYGFVVSVLCIVGLISFGEIRRIKKASPEHPEVRHEDSSARNSAESQPTPSIVPQSETRTEAPKPSRSLQRAEKVKADEPTLDEVLAHKPVPPRRSHPKTPSTQPQTRLENPDIVIGAASQSPAQPPVAIEMHALDSSVSYGYIEGGSIKVGNGENPVQSRNITLDHNVVDLKPWYDYMEGKDLPNIDLNTRPYLAGNITQVRFVEAPNGTSSLFLYVLMFNRGQPSTVSSWKLLYKSSDDHNWEILANAAPIADIVVRKPDNTIWYEFERSKSIQIQTEQRMGKMAAAIDGWIRFDLPPDAGLDMVQKKKAVVAVEFADEIGNNYQTALRRIAEITDAQ